MTYFLAGVAALLLAVFGWFVATFVIAEIGYYSIASGALIAGVQLTAALIGLVIGAWAVIRYRARQKAFLGTLWRTGVVVFGCVLIFAAAAWGVSQGRIRVLEYIAAQPELPESAMSSSLLEELGAHYVTQGRYAEAEPLFRRALEIGRKLPDANQISLAKSENKLAQIYFFQGRYGEAEPLFKDALAVHIEELGPDALPVGEVSNNLAQLYMLESRYVEAEPFFRRAYDILEKTYGPEHVTVANNLRGRAQLYLLLGKYAEAEPLFERALAILEKTRGPKHRDVAAALESLALLHQAQGRYDDAESELKRALAILTKTLGPDHPDLGMTLGNLAGLNQVQRRYGHAERLYKRSLAILEKALGREHPTVGAALANLGWLYVVQDRFQDAEPLFTRAFTIIKNSLGPDHVNTSTALANLATVSFAQRDWERAVNYLRQSTGIVALRARHNAEDLGHTLTGKGEKEVSRLSFQFRGLLKASFRLAAADRAPDSQLTAEMFKAAQWARNSQAAGSLAQMAARGAAGDAKLAALARERQDLVSEWQGRDAARTSALSRPPESRDKSAEAANAARLKEIDERIAEIDKRLAGDFPDYAALVSQKPVAVADGQSLLRDDEALVVFLDTPEQKPVPEETFVWVVTKTDSRWVRSQLGSSALKERVAVLRCGLDRDGNWQWSTDKSRWIALQPACTSLRPDGLDENEQLPFDLAQAHGLYKELFGNAEDLIKDKHLLIVPSGALTQLPFQVLVTRKPDPALSTMEALRSAAWLIRSHAITVLPSVSSLRALRQLAKASHASYPLIGFGNPLLDGRPDEYQEDAALALRAKANQSCPVEALPQVASLKGIRRGVRPLPTRGGSAEITQIRAQEPLPETATELCAVANDLGVAGDSINLGARATETDIKELSQSGKLAKYRIVYFATHGALAGEVGTDSEPGLLLTPPDKATDTDDGYLSASEIAALKLDADWVILSACNTAAAGANGAEALSGLARAFFYAGARALLVSHWAVYTDTTVKLLTGAISRMSADNSIGRAEAMRQSMLALIDGGAPYEARPAYWAPFVVVGEGAAPSH